jgi:hexosaminidase
MTHNIIVTFILALLATYCYSTPVVERYLVWPPAKFISATGAPLPISSLLRRVELTSNSADVSTSSVFTMAVSRFSARIERVRLALGASFSLEGKSPTTSAVSVFIKSSHDAFAPPALTTVYDYELNISPNGNVHISAASVYGAVYGLESLAQLLRVDESDGTFTLAHNSVAITDGPNFAWRGLMLDSGRRFFPMGLILNIFDSMAAAKLNVLHLHASDECRWSVESKLFPNLTTSLMGEMGGFYTQVDISVMIIEAASRGIRVIPEFDVPGHSRGLRPLKSEGIQFCDPGEGQSQIYGDPANSTFNVITALFEEMSTLFTDQVFNMGADETSALENCTTASTFHFERALLLDIETRLNKTAAGWEEILFDAGAATNKTIVYAWARESPQQIIDLGRRAVDSASGHFYMTRPGATPTDWSTFWFDISTGVTPASLPMLLGGEMSLWTDTWCDTNQCGVSGPIPVGAALFPPSQDAFFSRSAGGMIWPRGFVGAAAFWSYNASEDSQSTDFVNAIFALNDIVATAGGLVCPSRCECTQTTSCGNPYIPPPPPPFASLVALTCVSPTIGIDQTWQLGAAGTGDGILVNGNSSLCVFDLGGEGSYPLTVDLCTSGKPATWKWAGPPAPANLVSTVTNACMDVRTVDFNVGTYACGSGSGLNQTNQDFTLRADGAIVSATNLCLSLVRTSSPT